MGMGLLSSSEREVPQMKCEFRCQLVILDGAHKKVPTLVFLPLLF